MVVKFDAFGRCVVLRLRLSSMIDRFEKQNRNEDVQPCERHAEVESIPILASECDSVSLASSDSLTGEPRFQPHEICVENSNGTPDSRCERNLKHASCLFAKFVNVYLIKLVKITRNFEHAFKG